MKTPAMQRRRLERVSSRPESAPAVAERVRAACVDAAARAYEDAGISGLCAEGRWEAAVAAIRHLDLGRLLDAPAGSAPIEPTAR
jgi:hypothetical protein